MFQTFLFPRGKVKHFPLDSMSKEYFENCKKMKRLKLHYSLILKLFRLVYRKTIKLWKRIAMLNFLNNCNFTATSKTWTRILKNPDPQKHRSWIVLNKYGIENYVWPARVMLYLLRSYVHAQCDLLFKISQISKLNFSG